MRTFLQRFLPGLVAGLTVSFVAGADSIVIDGTRLDNVLVTKTSAFYYVQIPREGRTLNIPIEQVDEGSVVISDDPFLRDRLKEEYKENKELRDAGQEFEVNPAFRAGGDRVGGGGADLTPSGGSGGAGGGGGAGLGGSRTQLEQMLTNFGANFQPGPGRNGQPSVVASVSGAKLELIGPPDRLMGMIVSATATPQQVEMMVGQQRMMASQQSPEQAKLLTEIFDEAKQNGHAKRTANGVSVEVTYRKSGEMVDFEFKTLPAG